MLTLKTKNKSLFYTRKNQISGNKISLCLVNFYLVDIKAKYWCLFLCHLHMLWNTTKLKVKFTTELMFYDSCKAWLRFCWEPCRPQKCHSFVSLCKPTITPVTPTALTVFGEIFPVNSKLLTFLPYIQPQVQLALYIHGFSIHGFNQSQMETIRGKRCTDFHSCHYSLNNTV